MWSRDFPLKWKGLRGDCSWLEGTGIRVAYHFSGQVLCLPPWLWHDGMWTNNF